MAVSIKIDSEVDTLVDLADMLYEIVRMIEEGKTEGDDPEWYINGYEEKDNL